MRFTLSILAALALLRNSSPVLATPIPSNDLGPRMDTNSRPMLHIHKRALLPRRMPLESNPLPPPVDIPPLDYRDWPPNVRQWHMELAPFILSLHPSNEELVDFTQHYNRIYEEPVQQISPQDLYRIVRANWERWRGLTWAEFMAP